MSVNPEVIKSWSEAAAAALAALKAAKDLLPGGRKKLDAEKAIEAAERNLHIALASAAKELGFELCRRHWPPGIMILNEKDIYVCRDCGKPDDLRQMEEARDPKPRFDRARSGLSRPL